MHITLSGHHLDLTEALEQYVHGKIGRIERHCDNAATSAHVILSVDTKLQHKAEATLHVAGQDLYADATKENMYAAIDSMADKIDRQVKKHLEKLQDKHREEKVRHYEA